MITRKTDRPVVLAIAGFDPTGGAGVIVDLRTIEAFDCRAVAAVTSLTFQNSQAVSDAEHQTTHTLRAQLKAIISETSVAAIKIGMIPNRELIGEITRLLREWKLPPPVIDPVLRSSSGFDLIEEDAIELLMDELLPRARVITPNIPEAETLSGLRIEDEAGMRQAAAKLRAKGIQAVLVKGGHLISQKAEGRRQKAEETRQAIDLLYDAGEIITFRDEWIDYEAGLRGTGCMLSSAIAAGLARNKSLEESVRLAKDYVWRAIRDSCRKSTNELTAARES
jgi:hydroxymethylpyrimidine kinase/phosphomethylpyrimidine kinase